MTPPRLLPPTILNESERKEREQMKKYKHRSRESTLITTGMKTCFRLTVLIMMMRSVELDVEMRILY